MLGPQDWAPGRWLYKVKEKEKRTVWHLGNKTKKKKERERECVCCARVMVCAHACDVQESVCVCVRVICEREGELEKDQPNSKSTFAAFIVLRQKNDCLYFKSPDF